MYTNAPTQLGAAISPTCIEHAYSTPKFLPLSHIKVRSFDLYGHEGGANNRRWGRLPNQVSCRAVHFAQSHCALMNGRLHLNWILEYLKKKLFLFSSVVPKRLTTLHHKVPDVAPF